MKSKQVGFERINNQTNIFELRHYNCSNLYEKRI